MLQNYRIIFSIIVIIQLLHHEALYTMASQIQMERCPTMCTCDIYKKLNRANCRYIFNTQPNHFIFICFLSSSILILIFIFQLIRLTFRFRKSKCMGSGQYLISGYIGISSFVEWLDLSRNDITTIDNQCFHVSKGKCICLDAFRTHFFFRKCLKIVWNILRNFIA